jgi:hypothetical protein
MDKYLKETIHEKNQIKNCSMLHDFKQKNLGLVVYKGFFAGSFYGLILHDFKKKSRRSVQRTDACLEQVNRG